MSSAHSSADIARAFLVTPPPDEDVCSHCSAYHTTIGRCLIKIREHQYGVDDRLDEVERQNSDAQFQRWRKQSSSPPTQLSGFDFLETKIDELPIQEIKTQVEDLDEKLENINDNLAVRMTKVEDKMEMLDTTVDSLEESLIEESQRLEKSLGSRLSDNDNNIARLEKSLGNRLSNNDNNIARVEKSLGNRISDNDNNIARLNKKIELSITIARNVLVSRPLDIVPAMTFVHQEDGSWSEGRLPSRKLKWWWKLHNADKRPQLAQVAQAMRFEWKEILRELNAENSDTSSDEMDDDDNLDLPITTLQDMVRYRQKELVRAIFMHIGLNYSAIERKFNRAQEGDLDSRPPKRQSLLLSGRHHAIRRRTSQGEVRGSSYWGSPTIENELPNPALSSTSAGSGV